MLLRTKNTISDSIRKLIFKKYESGHSISYISQDLDINYATVQSIIRKFKTTGQICSSKKNCGRKKKINAIQETIIKNEISNDCSTTLKNIREILIQKTGVEISLSTLHRTIEDFEYSFKRVQLIPERRNITANIESRFLYARKIMTVDMDKLVFVDEMGVNCSMRKRYGRAKIGESPKKNITTVRSKNFSICAAIKKNGLFCFHVKDRPYNSESFLFYIRDLIAKFENENLKNMTIICDNVSFHKSNEIKEIIDHNGHNLVFLPPYSPQLNPIEEAFSAWKESIRGKNCVNKEDLFQAIDSESSKISGSLCEGFFRHMNYFLVKSISREEF